MMQQPTHPPHISPAGHPSHSGVPSYQLGPVHVPPQSSGGAPPTNDQPNTPDSADDNPRKRKTPPVDGGDDERSPSNQNQPAPLHHQEQPPPQHLNHPNHPHGPPQGHLHPSFHFQVPPGYVPVMPVPVGGPVAQQAPDGSSGGQSPTSSGPARALNNSKRAEQNRKAQRAFRERRDAHVKALESRSQLLDAALASVEEANRRWEESRQVVETLRMENAQLRAALNAYQQAGAAVAQMQHQIVHQQQHQQQQQQVEASKEGAEAESRGDVDAGNKEVSS